ncbi:MAG: hypothetical protein GX892_09780 [Thermoanaerobacteraceae bacterium]|nr:hypothetical protein [Thermoanaerobacteraceae bacterium]
MSTKDKREQEEIERKILKELKEEIFELKRQGKLYKFETAMDHAMEKFKKALKEVSEEAIEEINEGESKKKLSKMRKTSKNNELR